MVVSRGIDHGPTVRPYGAICTPLRPAFLTASSATEARPTTSARLAGDTHGDADRNGAAQP